MPEFSRAELQVGLQQGGDRLYELGYRDAMCDAARYFLRQARRDNQADGDHEPAASRAPARNSTAKSGRAPKGTVGEFIARTLYRNPGQTQRDIEIAADAEDDISTTSVGNELRRNEGIRYVKDEQKRWYFIGRDTNSISDRVRHPGYSAEPATETFVDRSYDSVFASLVALAKERDPTAGYRERERSQGNTQRGVIDDEPID